MRNKLGWLLVLIAVLRKMLVGSTASGNGLGLLRDW
jgi:hypothetical protein